MEAFTDAVKTLEEQYHDASYSAFVESPHNATLYDNYYHHSFFEELLAIVPKESMYSVLDVGCGNSILGRKLLQRQEVAPKFVSVAAVDSSAIMLNESKRLCAQDGVDMKLHLGAVGELPADLGLFDCIISGFFLAHAGSKEQLLAIFKDIAGHLRGGGHTIHVLPCALPGHDVPDGFVERVLLPLKRDDGTEDTIELFDYHWQANTYKEAVEKAGLVDFSFTYGQLSERGRTEFGMSDDTLPVRVAIIKAHKRLE
eukprot:TRINITY_DN50354_c0_g1_i1.p1 TRINITY_DN50354_c0_g1~~TRINITY_DN50354_c0_g1_i1.p1  ORF type:complete len:256 (+),score=42.65 TRINITY_DN50354_c0_g1_i1:77-844(+)